MPATESPPPKFGAPTLNQIWVQDDVENEDPLHRLWSEHWADISGHTNEDEDNQDQHYGEMAWMPSHFQEFSNLLGLTNEQEESL